MPNNFQVQICLGVFISRRSEKLSDCTVSRGETNGEAQYSNDVSKGAFEQNSTHVICQIELQITNYIHCTNVCELYVIAASSLFDSKTFAINPIINMISGFITNTQF